MNLACLLLSVYSSAIAASPQETSVDLERAAVVTRLTTEITVDGSLDEPEWQTAPKIGDLIQREPDNGKLPSQRTEATLLHDADNLYIGVRCYDSEPGRIVASQMARDGNLGSDDRISIVLDTYRDQRNAFSFSTNAVGAMVDGLVFSNGQSNNDWDAIWLVRTRRTEDGWTAEFQIPFKSLTFPSDRPAWGFNISRNIPRHSEEDRWSGARLDVKEFFQISEAGEISGMEGLSQGHGLDVRPFAAGRWLHNSATGHDALTGKPGLDLFYNITPSLKLSATVNTDFGETEVDARQINLTRFSLFFPEKRTFFLQDFGVFNFASTNTINPPPGVTNPSVEVYPFFSRTIGLLNGEEIPINFGIKLTGKVGRTDIGVLDVRTRDAIVGGFVIPGKNFFVGRVKQNFLEQSYVGAVFTDGNPAFSISSRTAGGDLRLATSHFFGRHNLELNAYGVRSINEGISDHDWSYGVSVEYPNDKYELQFALRDIQKDFRPALGFVQRSNVRLLRFGGSFNPRPKDFLGIQQMFHDFYYTRFTRLDNKLVESTNFYMELVDWHFRSGDALHSIIDLDTSYERLFEPFRIFPGVVLPVGEYRFSRSHFNFASASRRKVSFNVNASFGQYWSGHANTFQVGLTYRMQPHFTISFNSNQTFARLPQGNFVARIFTSNINYIVTPFLAFTNVIQYDNRSHNMGLQSRMRWILKPGNDIFVVLAQGWIQDPLEGGFHFNSQDTKLSSKIQYTFRF